MRYDFKKQLRSFGYAWQGIRSCVGKEQNLSFHLIAMTAVTLAGFVLGITRTEWTVVILCFGVVLPPSCSTPLSKGWWTWYLPNGIPLRGR